MDHFRLSDELRQQLLENAAWGKVGVAPRLDEAKKEEDKKEEGGYTDAESSKELEEAVHVCPLCVSQLDEPLDEESILEHLNVVVGLVDRLTQLQEGEEDIESVIDETLAELLFQDLEEE